MDRLTSAQFDLKNRLAEGLDLAMNQLAEMLAAGSPKFDIFIHLKSRYRAYLNAVMVGGHSARELENSYNQLTESFLLLVNSLTVNDLKPAEPLPAAARPKRGELLYYIPHAMQTNRDHACRVRVAYLLDALNEGWQAKPEDQRRSIRVAELMAVEMLDVSENQPFVIRAMTETIQFLDADDYTEWLFYVRPLREGEFPLLLKISVIEVINSRDVKKDVVIEEHVIVSGLAAEEAMVLKKSDVKILVQTPENQPTEINLGSSQSAPASAPAAACRSRTDSLAVALLLAALAFLIAGIFFNSWFFVIAAACFTFFFIQKNQ